LPYRRSCLLEQFWSQISRGENVHPADGKVFERMDPHKHGFRLDCLPSSFGGRLRDALVVLLYLSLGFGEQDVIDAQTDEGKDYYVRRWRGYEPIRDIKVELDVEPNHEFGDYETVKNKIALLNIGALSLGGREELRVTARAAVQPRVTGVGSRRSVPRRRGWQANCSIHAVSVVLGA
jgi:hypothetical protein